MDFVDAQRARELCQGPGAVVGMIELLELPVQAVIDKSRGQLQEKVAPESRLNPFQAHVVLQQAIQDRLADRVGNLALGSMSATWVRNVRQQEQQARYSAVTTWTMRML